MIIKRLISATIIFILSMNFLFCQDYYIGLTYEPSIVTSIFNDHFLEANPPIDVDFSPRLGSSIGLDYIFFNKSKRHGFKTGLYLLDNGYFVRETGYLIDRKLNIYYHFISIPFEYYKQYDRLYLNIGPNMSYATTGRIEDLDTGETRDYDMHLSIALGLKTEIGFQFAISERLEFKLGIFNRLFLFAEGNMNSGLLINFNCKLNK